MDTKKIHYEILQRLLNVSGRKHSRISKGNLEDYISIGAAVGYTAADMKQVIKENSDLDRLYISQSVNNFYKVDRGKPVLYDGVVYDSVNAVCRKLFLSRRQVDWLIKKGEAEYLEKD